MWYRAVASPAVMLSRVATCALAFAIQENVHLAKNESPSIADVVGLRQIHSVTKVTKNRHSAVVFVVQTSTVAAMLVKNTAVRESARRSNDFPTKKGNVR